MYKRGYYSKRNYISDRDVDKYEYDYHITNDGTLKELQQKAKEFVEKLK